MQVIIKIIEAVPPTLSGEQWSEELREILAHMLKKEPTKRPTCNELLDKYARGFLSKASNAAYLKAKLLKDITPVIGDALLQEQGKLFKQKNAALITKQPLNWNFSGVCATVPKTIEPVKQSTQGNVQLAQKHLSDDLFGDLEEDC